MRYRMGIAIAAALAVTAAGGTGRAADGEKPGTFEAFKKLAGEWTGKATFGEAGSTNARVVYRVTSGGSAVVETMDPGGPHEMETVIHQDGDDVMLTHYCSLGNQPQMKTAAKLEGNQAAFKFIRATNLKSLNGPHMHEVTYTFVDADTLRSEWTFYQDGKPAGKAVFEKKRKKAAKAGDAKVKTAASFHSVPGCCVGHAF